MLQDYLLIKREHAKKNLEVIKRVLIFVHSDVLISVNMLTTSISDFRKNIKKYLDSVTKNFETLIINRGKGSGVVIISLDEYNSLTATQHEMSSKENEARLDTAIEKLKQGSSFPKDLIES
ncbi:MAG: type II toxin-antitoxin system prevent-host-death family antitoxin [Bacteroidales bacterium]